MTNRSDSLENHDGGCTGNCRSGEDKDKQKQQPLSNTGDLPDRQLMPLMQPMPILEQPKVMRVWVAPYKDENDDLHWPTYVFTEVTPRRWAVGENAAKEAAMLTPMQVDTSAADRYDGQQQANLVRNQGGGKQAMTPDSNIGTMSIDPNSHRN